MHCHLRLIFQCHIFTHYVTKAHDFQKSFLIIKCLFLFSSQPLPETFIARRSERDMLNMHMSSCKQLLFLSNFNQPWIFWTDLRKKLKSYFPKNLSIGSQVFTCGRTNRRTNNMTNLIVAFRKFVKKLKTSIQNHIPVYLHNAIIPSILCFQ